MEGKGKDGVIGKERARGDRGKVGREWKGAGEEGGGHINQNKMEKKHTAGGKSRVKQGEQSHLGHEQVLTPMLFI